MDKFFKNGGLPWSHQCTNESIVAEDPNIALGVFSIIFGAVFIPLYCVCLAALVQADLRGMVVYKIMIFLSVYDITALVLNSLITGIFFIKGVVFCTYPLPIYIFGCFANGCWGASCIGCFCLVFTRFVDLWSRRWHEFLFGGKRAYVVIVLCVAYSSCFILLPSPAVFNAKYYSWIFDPIIDDSGNVFEVDFSWFIAANNLTTVTSTFTLYIAFFISFQYKYHVTYGYRLGSHEKQMFVQSCAISGVNVTLALAYVYMLYFPVTITVTATALFLWQLSSAGAVVVYLGINRTIRRKVLQMITKKKLNITTVSAVSSKP